nr:GntR family transcriptional regulator [Dermatophilus congolensis]
MPASSHFAGFSVPRDIAAETKTESKSERVYRVIRDGISSGKYSPGYRLVLSRLATDFNVSPVPVREAVRKLEAQGLVTHIRNVGFEVTGVDQQSYTEAMQTLAVLQAAATALSVETITSETLDAAQELNNEMRRVHESGDAARFTELNTQFHRLLCSHCPNARILNLIEREVDNLSQIRRSTFAFVPGRVASSIEEHDEIIRALREETAALDVELMLRHHTLRTLNSFLERHQ